jgi:hypothetical protein
MNNNKGLAPILITIIVLVVLLIGGIAYYVGKSSTPTPQSTTDTPFSTSSITVLSPNGGETWKMGESVKITWTSSKDIKFVNIGLNVQPDLEGGQSFGANIVSRVSNSGSYDWTVQKLYAVVWGTTDLPASNKYSVYIEDSEHSSTWDKSDKFFTIVTEEQIGSIKNIYQKGGKYYLDIDYVQWISDEKTCVDRYSEFNNDYCIVNDNPLLRTFSISDDVKVELQTYSHDASGGYVWNQVVPLSTFAIALNNSYVVMNPEYPARDLLYWVTLVGGVVTNISEQYQP